MRGVVEKCNFCDEQLAVGELPLCVKSCSAGALTFGNLNDAQSQLRLKLDANNTIRRKPELGTHPRIYYLI